MDENYQPLKDERAEELRKKGSIQIGDKHIKLWTNQNWKNAGIQFGWDHVRDLSYYNESSSGLRGNVVFTGTFQIPREEAVEIATQCGYNVNRDVTQYTKYIVVGSENVAPSKVAKAMKLIEAGHDIKFVVENEFLTHLADIMDNPSTHDANATTNKRSTEPTEEEKSLIVGCLIWVGVCVVLYGLYRMIF